MREHAATVPGGTDEPEVVSTDRKRRTAVIAGALVLGLLAGGGLLLFDGGSEDVVASGAAPVAPAEQAAPALPTATPSAAPSAVAGPARDPFLALYEPVSTVPGAATGSAGAPAAPPPSSGAAVPGQPAPPAAGPADPVPAPGRLSLAEVTGSDADRKAVFVVDGVSVTVSVGDSFGDQLLLLSVQQGPAVGQWTAVVQQGTGDPFDVMTGAPAVQL